jgi:hypothetical protein
MLISRQIIIFMKHINGFVKWVMLFVTYLLSGLSAQSQTIFIPATHVDAFYMNGQCQGRIQIRTLYQERNQNRLDNCNYYYLNASSNWILFATINTTTAGAVATWTDGWGGASRTWGLHPQNGHSLNADFRTNQGNLSYVDFIFNNVPAAAFRNGIITISVGGQWSGNTGNSWSHTTGSSSKIVTLPTLSPPTGLVATNALHCDKIALSWIVPTSFPCSYVQEVYRNNTLIHTINSTTQDSYDDISAPSGPVSYSIKAVHRTTSTSGVIESFNSNTSTGAKIASASAPSGITVTDNRCDGRVLISWSFFAANPINFKIFRATDAAGPYTEIATVDAGERSYLDQPPLRSTNYHYKVATTGTCGQTLSALSYIGASPTVPTAPTNVVATTNGSNTGFNITWTDNSSDETGFVIERSIQGTSGSTLFYVDANVTSYGDNTVLSCVNYVYTIRARNSCTPAGTPSVNNPVVRIFPNISNSFNTTTNKLTASKGYFTNMVQLEWSTINVDILNQYRIFRKQFNSTNDSILIGTVNQGAGNFIDNNAISGVLYKYTIVGVLNCAGFTLFSNVSEDIGFRTAFGTVSGSISYAGGIALEHARVIVSPASASFVGASMHFPNTTGYLNVPSSNKLNFTTAITLETWFNTTNVAGTKELIRLTSGAKTLTLRLNNNNLQLHANNGSLTRTLTSTSTFLANNYNQATAVFRADSMILYLNGIRSGALSLAGFTQFPMGNSSIRMGTSFEGHLDEVRIYNRAKTINQVTEDFSRRVNPDDNGLLAYYTFDENIVGYNGFFDYSRVATIFNEHHGTTVNAQFGTNIPSTSQLSYSSFTDDKGSYIVTNIGYTGTGQVFTITPSFDVHSFLPINRTVFIGEGAIVHNQQDFTDESSFPVSGTVFFANSSCASEGVFLKVDGNFVVRNGERIRTDQNGAFEIEVPIGNHVVTAEKDGHIFSAGRFPTSGAFNFQNAVSGIQFIDSTLIKVVGRAVGGAIEANKKPGLGHSINNIGKTRIHFRSQQGNGCSRLSVVTNDTTGEYVAYLPPLIYVIDTARVPTQANINFGTQSVLNLSNATNTTAVYDTIYLPGSSTISRIDSVRYNVRRDFIYYTAPQIAFSRMRNRTITDTAFVGEVRLNIDSVTSIDLVPTNPFEHPVFLQFRTYGAHVYAYDEYVNRDRIPNQNYRVPLDGSLIINNDIASSDTKLQAIQVTNGYAQYQFFAGSPNLTLDNLDPSISFTKAMQATFFTVGNNGDRSVSWLPNGGQPYRGIVFGGRGRGTNFITSGPEKVDLILRDPPGSASSATWARETNFTTVKRWSNLNNVGGSFMGTVYLGVKFELSTGIGLTFGKETEIGGRAGFGVTKNTTKGENGELVETLSSSISISTGGGPDQVGGNADIFFGRSTNYAFGIADNLMLITENECNAPGAICTGNIVNGYALGVKSNLALDPRGINTVFAYTTGEIEDIVIPNLVRARNSVLLNGKKKNGQPRYTINFTNTNDALYELKYAANNDDPIWGTARNNNNPLLNDLADRTGPSYTFLPDSIYDIDSVRMYNNQIRLWKEALARNEQEKYEIFAQNLGSSLTAGTNTSIGKASLTREFSTTRSRDVVSTEEVYLAHDQAWGFKAIFGGSGIDFDGTLTLGETTVTEDGTVQDSTTTISYTLQDGDDGDLISVDIVDPGTGNGHIFRLRGGQTSCPYEGPEWARYYRPGDTVHATTYFDDGTSVKLSEGTAQRHVPRIQIPQSIRFNVPADQAANFNLQLGNMSESEDDQEYSLRVVESTNPFGAIITIDGLDPNRNFTVPYGTSINKTLIVRRGPLHYDYDSILLIFKSPCDDDIVDSVYISVYFIPTCTQPIVQVPDDKWTLNNIFRDTMNVIISGYDYNFGGLKNITLQYKPSSSSAWTILETFHLDPPTSSDKIIPSNQPYIEYIWNMRQLPDGPYDIRAVSRCSAPRHSDALISSPVNRGLADRVNPAPFGNPSPADGILSPNDEISIQFNEPIDNASLSFQNFDIRGVLNGSTLQNTASIFFDGNNDFVEIPTGLNLTRRSFSLEFWARRGTLGQQVVFSQGVDPNQYFAIGFDADNRFYFRIGNDIVRSNTPQVDTVTYIHYTMSYDFDNERCELFVNGFVSNTGNTQLFNKYEGGGKTFIGILSNASGHDFRGNLRDFRLWSRTRQSAEILSSINRSLRGTEAGIVANWRMDEASGNVVKDYVRARHAELKNATWEINPKGSSYKIVNEPLVVSASDIAFTKEADFTFEFWFKGDNTPGEVALFSNGRGDSTDVNPEIRWSIEKDNSGKIIVKHKGLNFEAVSSNFFDGNWHHFALVMTRATSLTAFVDGNLQNSTNSSDFDMFGGNRFWVGGRGYQPPVGPDEIDRTFNGFVDEIRIWNSARTQAQIERDRLNRLSGSETDIVLYIPFEQYNLVMGVPILTPSAIDIRSTGRSITGATALGSGLSDESPTIKLQRPVQSINFVYSLNQDKIILTPTTLPSLIENVTLDITVRNVFDLNGNRMQSPRTWIAFVDRNQVKWQDSEFNFNKKKGDPLTFTTNIVNSGGELKQFTIQNLPPWLTATPSSGTILPNSVRTIQLSIDPNVNIGQYENDIHLLTDFGFPDGLMIKLKVFAEPPSNWTVNPANFQNTMSIVGQIRVNNVISTNPDDKLAAFVNGQCRGIAGLQYFPQIDRYYAFMNVYSNVATGEEIEFRIWNAGEGKIHSDVTPSLQFQTNALVGSIIDPQIFNATDKLTRFIPIRTGWNWISFNLLMKDSTDINKILRPIASSNGDILRNQTLFADFSADNGWAGSLANTLIGVKPETSYRLRSTTVDTLEISGVEIDPTIRPINLQTGWNWIGFVSQRNLSVTEALSSLNSSNGDLITSQTQFALYDNRIGWVGSLSTLIPNRGYMYRSATTTTFAYPRSAMFGKKDVDANEYASKYFAPAHTQYENNMNLIVEADVCKDALVEGRLSIGAYSGNELRGASRITAVDNDNLLYFLTVSGNTNEPLTFKLLDEQTGKTINLNGTINFTSNKLEGSLNKPVLLSPEKAITCEDYTSKLVVQQLSLTASPNPYKTDVMFTVKGLQPGEVKVTIYDLAGKLVDEFGYDAEGKTRAEIEWNPAKKGLDLNSGFYFVEIINNNQSIRTKLLKY